MRILFKYPSRGRKALFLEGLKSITDNMYDLRNYQVLVTADSDDDSMAFTDEELSLMPNTKIVYGVSNSKIHAINKDIELADDWDIIVCMSDDMRVNCYGFDQILRTEFNKYGLDTLLHIPDQDAKSALQTMYIAGKTYFNRFGFIYNPEYESLFCDNEVHEIAVSLGKYIYVDMYGLITHLNPAYGHLPKDEMFIKQQEIGFSKDQETYIKRKAKNFYL